MKDPWKKAGLAAVILLAPGGFVLGATLLAKHYRDRRSAKDNETPPDELVR